MARSDMNPVTVLRGIPQELILASSVPMRFDSFELKVKEFSQREEFPMPLMTFAFGERDQHLSAFTMELNR
jgi:hypothetical protein